jgi:N-acetyl-gamma-glutamyl-phosphate reductase
MDGTTTATKTIFIDGEAGTTGLGIRQLLGAVDGVSLRQIDPALRKDAGARKAMFASVDLVVLCLPDDAAKESVALIDTLGAKAPRVVDASTAHRTAPGWVYGFPELSPGHKAAVAAAARVGNPGCYPTGAIALVRPLIDAGLMAKDFPLTVNAVSGYSGGGKSMIETYEAGKAPSFELYGLGLEHKHLPELMAYTGLTRRPIFVPSVGNFRQGMLVSVPVHLDMLAGKPKAADLHAALVERYTGSTYVKVVPAEANGKLEAEALNGSNDLELRVFGNDKHGHAVLVARLDNLGKGASGAAVQNIRTMLGLA